MVEPEDIGTPGEGDAQPPREERESLREGVLEGKPRPAQAFSWREVNPRRAALLLLLVAAVVGLLAWGALALFGGKDADLAGKPAATGSPDRGSAEDTRPTADYGSDEVTDPIAVDDDDGERPAQDFEPIFDDAGMVAYRIDGELWVANEDGTDRRFVTDLPVGPFSLAPDGSAVAIVNASSMTLELVDIASGSGRVVGKALASTPVWSPDSRWLLFARAGSAYGEIWRVDRDGHTLSRLAVGHAPHVIPDATRFAVLTRDRSGRDDHAIQPFVVGGPPDSLVETEDRVIDFSWDGDVLARAVQDGTGKSRIVAGSMAEPDGGLLAGPPAGVGFMVGYQQLSFSPDGGMLAYTAAGDDGYSRLFVVPTAGGTAKELSTRRDAYMLRWSRCGEYVLFIEGNSFQGEESRLVRVRPDGTGRSTLIEGAGL